ncbi:MAG: hypothetical protein GTO14_21510 [Anaerolineales bacterium]|nr:hypothetical protein [Anaerolineales bacterium]
MKRLLLIPVLVSFAVSCTRWTRVSQTSTPDLAERPTATFQTTETPIPSAIQSYTLLREQGGRVSWLHTQDLIAFDAKGEDRYFDVYIMNLDGTDLRCLTCATAQVPQRNNGNPAWHPSGEWLVFQAQDPDLSTPTSILSNYITSPGVAVNNNLWVAKTDGSGFWQITEVEARRGALHPHFSPDGTKLIWSEMIENAADNQTGTWEIRMADFSIQDEKPLLTNIQASRPEDLQLYEMHGFSLDGKTIIFSGVEWGKYYYDLEIYTMNITTGDLQQLTNNDEWDEHAHFSPDGETILWVSSDETPQVKSDTLPGIIEHPPKFEYWIMNADGSCKRRLSGFNHPQSPEYWPMGGGIGLGDFDWGPDGKTIVAKWRLGYGREAVALIQFDFSVSDVCK